MRNFAFLGASALILALGVGVASAEPFDPVTGYSGANSAAAVNAGTMNEGRAAYNSGWTTGNPVLQQFHEGK